MKDNIKNWEIGDCFIKKIETEKYPEYNGKYLLLICSGYYNYNNNNNNNKRMLPNVYIKLSNKEVTTTNDIDEAEFVISLKIHWSLRFLPYSGLVPDEILEKERSKIQLYPDEYWFLTEYQSKLAPSRKNKEFIKDCKYIRHINFKRPEDEFYHWMTNQNNHFQMVVLPTKWAIDLILKNYREFNLRKSVFYQIPLEEMAKCKNDLTPIYQKYYTTFMEKYNPDEH